VRLIKQASGKTTIKFTRKEWEDFGKKAGWVKEAWFSDDHDDSEEIDRSNATVQELTTPEEVARVSEGGKWATSDPEQAKMWLSKGSFFLVHHDNHPYALCHPNSGKYLSVHDEPLTPDEVLDIVELLQGT
jgi:hypothetical protein